jgi:hypothetical protein
VKGVIQKYHVRREQTTVRGKRKRKLTDSDLYSVLKSGRRDSMRYQVNRYKISVMEASGEGG